MAESDKVAEAVDFLQRSNDAESQNRQRGLEALRFRYGKQWPDYAITSRGNDRPQLTINETNTYIKKVTNQQRQQRPRGKASPVDSFADKKIAKVITGLGRHVEVNSDADHAYDTAFDFAATIGFGYWRLRMDYTASDSFDQDVYIDCLPNPFAVYFDPNSKLPDGSDAEGALITDTMSIEAFEAMYPDSQIGMEAKADRLWRGMWNAMKAGFTERGTGDSDPDWLTKDSIRLAEYYFIERKAAKLVKLSDNTVIWESQLPPPMVLKQAGVVVIGTRESHKRMVRWRKQTAFDILDEKDLPGEYIPVVPVYWTRVQIDSERRVQGLVQDAMDPQRMLNFWQTSITEALALAPKAKWLMAEGQDEDHEGEWASANISARPVLRYKPTDVNGQPMPPPQRVQPEQPPAGMIEAAFMASQNLSRVMGIFDPAVRGGAQHKSDKTLNAEAGQSEMANYDGYDNLIRSIKHSWRIMLSYFPVVYDTQRVQRIIGEDGRDEMVTLNEKQPAMDENGQPKLDEDGMAIQKVLNDVTVGSYDVVMETGPGYNTRRQEGVAATMDLMATPIGEKVAQVADDLIVRQMDFQGADMIADRLAAANPLSQIDEKDDVPPKVQMMVKSLQSQLQQAGQQIQSMQTELRLRGGIEQMKQDAATKRTLLTTTTKAHESEMWAREEARQVDSVERTRMHDTEVRALSAQNVEEIRALAKLLSDKLGNAHALGILERETEENERELAQKSDEVPMTPAPMQ